MLWAALAYSLGITAGAYLWRPALWWVIAGAAFIVFAAYFTRRRSLFGWGLALGAIFLVGALHIQLRRSTTGVDTSIDDYADRQ